jgi:pyridoxal phosphate enzyme (YggS family)
VDSFKLLNAINKEAKKCNRIISVLLQFHIAIEETKFGLSLSEAMEMLSLPECLELKHVSISGVMGMASFTDNQIQVKNEFQELHRIFDLLKKKFFSSNDHFREISMGMSDDYSIAVNEGSTMVRIGSLIFGNRSSKI